ncbi:MAG: cobalamin-dependent protein [Pseudomonadota bacterium]
MPSMKHSDPIEALEGIGRVALKAVTNQALEQNPPAGRRRIIDSYVARLMEASIDPDQRAVHAVVTEMRKALVTDDQIAATYIAQVAARLGDAWVADKLDFGAVTIGAARLQGLLHHLATATIQIDDHGQPPAFLIGVPEGIQHTLGACIVADQLRRRGLFADLQLSLTRRRFSAAFIKQSHVGILLSASGIEHLETLKNLIDCLKSERRGTPVIIGGPILTQIDDILSFLPADFATCDIDEALSFCDVKPVLPRSFGARG